MREQRILIVDDNAKNIQVIANALSHCDVEISFANSGEEALKILNESNFDLVLLDIIMPGMDGFEVCNQIKMSEALKTIPVIFLTGKTEYDDVVKGFEIGGVDYITKPFNNSELVVRVANHLLLREYQCHLEERVKEETAKLLNANKLLGEYKKAVDVCNIVSKADTKGLITYVNDEFCRISGYVREELIGKPHNIVRHPNMPKEAFEEMWKTITSKKVWKGLVENRAKNGSSYFVDATIVPIIDENDEIVEYIGVRKDITPLIQKEKELEKFRTRQMNESVDKAIKLNLKAGLDLSPVPTFILDSDNTIVFYNKEFEEFISQNAYKSYTQLVLGNAAFSEVMGLKNVQEDDLFDWKELCCEIDDVQVYLQEKPETKYGLKVKQLDSTHGLYTLALLPCING